MKIPVSVLKIIESCSRDAARPVMQGVLFEVDGDQCRAIATDGRQLVVAEWPNDGKFPNHQEIIGATDLRRVKPHRKAMWFEIDTTSKNITAQFSSDTIKYVPLEGFFPNWKLAIPAPDVPHGFDSDILVKFDAIRLAKFAGTIAKISGKSGMVPTKCRFYNGKAAIFVAEGKNSLIVTGLLMPMHNNP